MSDTTRLTQLAQFDATSPLASDDTSVRESALRGMLKGLETPRPVHRRVTDLLGVVLALSARTRRMVMPRVAIDVDVFAPGGRRAVQLHLPPED
ncbi:hypothetical protein [Pelagibacterium xiamenense]|uniref:hypothetical protein n=1 Tax=Pelagibacterium xiamenense TaxID=2901140 RepID=UPI001E2A34D3|nr:hypothetical protein [Pelagibacterium xiamenense]MCD7061185.1 hypothetical protein [Pelagibacterium xiamenense]